ncbi:tyrosine-type recombinase/integrase [Sandarakinorhabdus sp.]|uniref:tyrosine-type recombinase/integrase n=1 Tax=Sandarakinorhabdus sp. TaxID=1916663 RepID=UPI003F718F4B
MKVKLTLQTVKAIKPDQRSTVWDTEVKGFGLRVNADGTKTYILKYLFQGRQRWYTIGKHGSPYTPTAARDEAIRLLGQAKSNEDPIKARKAERAAKTTVAQLCDDYLTAAEEGRLLTKSDRPKKPSTLATDRGRIERHVKPLLGKKRVVDVTQKDIEKFMFDIAAGATAANVKTKKFGRAIVEGGQGTASRTVGFLGGVFTYAVKIGLRSDNPVRGVRRFKDRKNERYLTAEELRRLGRVLQDAEDAWRVFECQRAAWIERNRAGEAPTPAPEAEDPVAVEALRFLALTGARKSEVLELTWDCVDLEYGYLRLKDSKTGAKAVPLGKAAIDLLQRMPTIEGNPYVFPGKLPGRHLVGLPRIWERLRVRANLADVRMHDLRHSFASIGASGGDSLLMIGALLGHRDTRTTQRYAHLANEPVRDAADRISSVISAALGGLPSAGAKEILHNEVPTSEVVG